MTQASDDFPGMSEAQKLYERRLVEAQKLMSEEYWILFNLLMNRTFFVGQPRWGKEERG